MESDQHLPDYDALTVCTWCGAPLGQNEMPKQSATLFCSRRCQIEGNFWVFQELCAIEITNPQQNKDSRDHGL
jgi:endogenous inhibitor of DNA gyrase (YacG/DUF329 family)